jgi:hypothetical protein
MKKFFFILLLSATIAGSYYYYHYEYVETLRLSEIIDKTDNPMVNLAVNILDFDTGLTRHDIKHLKNNKEYWIGRINQLDAIQGDNQKQEAVIQLLADFFDDPVVKKLKPNLTAFGANSSLEIIKTIFQN